MQSTFLGQWGPGGPLVLVTVTVTVTVTLLYVFADRCLMASLFRPYVNVRRLYVKSSTCVACDLILVSCIYGFGPAALYMWIFMFFELLPPYMSCIGGLWVSI